MKGLHVEPGMHIHADSELIAFTLMAHDHKLSAHSPQLVQMHVYSILSFPCISWGVCKGGPKAQALMEKKGPQVRARRINLLQAVAPSTP